MTKQALGTARPFVKMAGGKTKLLPELLARVPTNFGTYHEPFVGGGALFWALRERIDSAIISDTSTPLVLTYRTVKADVEALIRRLKRMPNEREYFDRQRLRDPAAEMGKARMGAFRPACTSVAAWYIYLNKTCYNGLWRVNKRGMFNAPFAGYANPTICDEENLRACSSALRGVSIYDAPFERVLDRARKGDLVYFDPPYLPLSPTSSFTAYGAAGFILLDHMRLRDVALALKKRGVHVILSNSAAPETRDLYRRGFTVEEVQAPRAINSKGDGRKKIPELLIT